MGRRVRLFSSPSPRRQCRDPVLGTRLVCVHPPCNAVSALLSTEATATGSREAAAEGAALLFRTSRWKMNPLQMSHAPPRLTATCRAVGLGSVCPQGGLGPASGHALRRANATGNV